MTVIQEVLMMEMGEGSGWREVLRLIQDGCPSMRPERMGAEDDSWCRALRPCVEWGGWAEA